MDSMQHLPPWLCSPSSSSETDPGFDMFADRQASLNPANDHCTYSEFSSPTIAKTIKNLEIALGTSTASWAFDGEANETSPATPHGSPLNTLCDGFTEVAVFKETLDTSQKKNVGFTEMDVLHKILRTAVVEFENIALKLSSKFKELDYEYDVLVEKQLENTITPISSYLEDVLHIPIPGTPPKETAYKFVAKQTTFSPFLRRQSHDYESSAFETWSHKELSKSRHECIEGYKNKLFLATLEHMKSIVSDFKNAKRL